MPSNNVALIVDWTEHPKQSKWLNQNSIKVWNDNKKCD